MTPLLQGDELESLQQFMDRFKAGDPYAGDAISDALLDKFAWLVQPMMHLQRLNRWMAKPVDLSSEPRMGWAHVLKPLDILARS